MSQYVPGTMKFQLESHVVVELRISPLINKMSVQPMFFYRALPALSILLSSAKSKYEECEMHKNPELFMWAMFTLSAKILLSHRIEKLSKWDCCRKRSSSGIYLSFYWIALSLLGAWGPTFMKTNHNFVMKSHFSVTLSILRTFLDNPLFVQDTPSRS